MGMISRQRINPKAAQNIAKGVFRHENVVLLMVLIVFVASMGVITKGLTISRANVLNVLLQSSIRGVAAIGEAFVILTAGIDISVGGVGLFASTVGAALITTNPEVSIGGGAFPAYVGVATMLAIGIGWGALNGSAVSRLSMSPLIMTLAIWQITQGLAYQAGKGLTIMPLPEPLEFLGSGTVTGVPVLAIIFIAAAVVSYFILEHTTFGRSVYAVGANPVAAWLSGIKVDNILLSVYMISGFMAGLAGAMMTARAMSSSVLMMSGLELDAIGAVFVGGLSMWGGKGNMIGAILGVIIIGVVNNAMSVLSAGAAVQGIVKGAIIIVAVGIDCLRRR
jgi:putative xylitol transport system permease protein